MGSQGWQGRAGEGDVEARYLSQDLQDFHEVFQAVLTRPSKALREQMGAAVARGLTKGGGQEKYSHVVSQGKTHSIGA